MSIIVRLWSIENKVKVTTVIKESCGCGRSAGAPSMETCPNVGFLRDLPLVSSGFHLCPLLLLNASSKTTEAIEEEATRIARSDAAAAR